MAELVHEFTEHATTLTPTEIAAFCRCCRKIDFEGQALSDAGNSLFSMLILHAVCRMLSFPCCFLHAVFRMLMSPLQEPCTSCVEGNQGPQAIKCEP